MRALVWHGAQRLDHEDAPDPAPADDEVILRVELAGICGSALHGSAEDLVAEALGDARVDSSFERCGRLLNECERHDRLGRDVFGERA